MKFAEQPFGPNYMFAGALIDEEQSFRFEVWARGALSQKEIDAVYGAWRRSLKKTTRIRNRTVRVQCELGSKR